MALASLVTISGPKKVTISSAHPFQCNGSCTPQNHYVPRHINNRYSNSYYLCIAANAVKFLCKGTELPSKYSDIVLSLYRSYRGQVPLQPLIFQ